tara:strand:- start:178 stop:1329 length:1152 start_codon:yes stop_codon:yes gene_type:complete
MIGVAAIIIVMSVMNGFREELTNRILGINGHLNIYSKTGEINIEQVNILKNIKYENDITILPTIETQALLINDENSRGVYLRGYSSNDIKEKNFLIGKIKEGRSFSENPNDILVGYILANKLGLKVGQKVKIAIPKTNKTIFGNIPRFKTLIISGIFDLGMYEYDSNLVFTNSIIPRKLIMINDESFNKIEIFSDDPNNIEILQKKINNEIKSISKYLYTFSWKENNASLINALKVEKNVMFLILSLIILVASMNIISGLIIFVKEKNKDIGILKTIGLNDFSLIKIFITIGFIIGFIGTFLGGLLGLIFSMNIVSIQLFLEKIFDSKLFSKEIYYLSTLPSKINNTEVIFVLIISIVICLFATVFPAYRSSTIDPIKTLKND